MTDYLNIMHYSMYRRAPLSKVSLKLKHFILFFQVWELSDPTGKGFLDKDGFFVAVKLIALAQNGQDVSMANVNAQIPPPTMVSPFVLYVKTTCINYISR